MSFSTGKDGRKQKLGLLEGVGVPAAGGLCRIMGTAAGCTVSRWQLWTKFFFSRIQIN